MIEEGGCEMVCVLLEDLVGIDFYVGEIVKLDMVLYFFVLGKFEDVMDCVIEFGGIVESFVINIL